MKIFLKDSTAYFIVEDHTARLLSIWAALFGSVKLPCSGEFGLAPEVYYQMRDMVTAINESKDFQPF